MIIPRGQGLRGIFCFRGFHFWAILCHCPLVKNSGF